jgi:hypothetical protein
MAIPRNLIAETETRLELLIVLGIFFPTLVYSFLKLTVPDQGSNATSLSWASLIALYLSNYVFFELLKGWIDRRWMEWINGLSLGGVAMFIFPVAVFASEKIGALWFLTYISFQTSLYALQVIPIVTLGALMIQFFMKIMFNRGLKKD